MSDYMESYWDHFRTCTDCGITLYAEDDAETCPRCIDMRGAEFDSELYLEERFAAKWEDR